MAGVVKAARMQGKRAAVVPYALVTMLAVAALMLRGNRAHAQTAPDTHLSWVRTPGTADACPAAADVAGMVTRRLGRDPFTHDPSKARRRVEVLLELSRADEVRAQLWAAEDAQPAARRDLHAPIASCQTLAEAVSLAVALLIDPQSLSRPQPPVPPPASLPAPTGDVAPAPRFAALTMGAASSGGLLPKPGPGFAVRGRIGVAGTARDHWDATAGALVLTEVRADDPGFAFGLSAAHIGLCRSRERGALTLAACADALAGVVHAFTFSSRPTSPGDQAFAGARVAAIAGFRLAGPLDAVAEFGVVAPLVRHKFVVEGSERVIFRPAGVGGTATVGLALRLP